YFNAGGGIELHGGARFLKYFAAFLFYEYHILRPGSELDLTDGYADNVTLKNTASAQNLGIGVSGGTPAVKLRVFGEIGFAFLHRFDATQDVTYDASGCTGEPSKTSWQNKLSYSGNAFRIG